MSSEPIKENEELIAKARDLLVSIPKLAKTHKDGSEGGGDAEVIEAADRGALSAYEAVVLTLTGKPLDIEQPVEVPDERLVEGALRLLAEVPLLLEAEADLYSEDKTTLLELASTQGFSLTYLMCWAWLADSDDEDDES